MCVYTYVVMPYYMIFYDMCIYITLLYDMCIYIYMTYVYTYTYIHTM